MKRRNARRNVPAARSGTAIPPVTDRRIIWINDAPLRKRATGEYSRAMDKLESARAELRRFEQEERPAFQRWMSATFGALLTEIRENERQILDQQNILFEVEEAARSRRTGGDARRGTRGRAG
jgi:hypothetical protein